MDYTRLAFCLIFFAFGASVTTAQVYKDPLVVEHATEEEARQVQEVADAFERRMRETRDVGLLKDLFLDDFVRVQMNTEVTSFPDKGISLIGSVPLSLKLDLAPQVSQRDWERFYAARLNLRYYFVLLIASRMKPSDFKNECPTPATVTEKVNPRVNETKKVNPRVKFMRKLYPAEVLTLLQANPFVKAEYGLEHDHSRHQIETLEEFLSLIDTLDQAALMLRQRFLKHPPEQTSTYQKNLRRAEKEHRTIRKEGLIWPHVYGTDKSIHGFPQGTRFYHRITADSMFEMSFVKTDTGVKIVRVRVYPFN